MSTQGRRGTGHILISQGAQDREAKDLGRRLKAVVINYRFRLISKKNAIRKGTHIITEHYNKLLALSKRRIRVTTSQVAELSPDSLRQLEQWRDQYIANFKSIIGDVK